MASIRSSRAAAGRNSLTVPTSHFPPPRSASSPQLSRGYGSRGELESLIHLSPKLPLRGIFDIGKGHYDVVLEDTKISWTPIQGSGHAKGEHFPKVVSIKDIFAVQIRRIQRVGQEFGGHPRGVSMFIVQPKKGVANGLMWSEVTLSSSNESHCQEWFQALMNLVNGFTRRPKRLAVFIDTLSSSCQPAAKQVFEHKIQPLFNFARIQANVIETNHKRHVQEELERMDYSDIDGVVCVGGDTIANEAVNGLLLRAQRDAGVAILHGTPMAKCRIPLGIIAVGLFNIVAHSSQGVSDPVTSALHIILGHLQPLDACSIFNDAGFMRFGFSAMYGFGSDCLRRAVKSQGILKSKAVEYAVAKSLLKIKTYECEVSYLTSQSDSSSIQKDDICKKGCQLCGHSRDLSNLVSSTPLPLRIQDSPLVLRRNRPSTPPVGHHLPVHTTPSASPTASAKNSPRPSPGPSPRPSPRSSPLPGRANSRSASPSLLKVAWSLETTESTSEECLVKPKGKKKDKNKSSNNRDLFEMSSSAPPSRQNSSDMNDSNSRHTTASKIPASTNRPASGDSTTDRMNIFLANRGVPSVNVTITDPGQRKSAGIGIVPKEDNNDVNLDSWRTFQDSFISVGIVTLPNRSVLVPRGISPRTHLADGTADLILVRKAGRKEYIKHLQRHGSHADQFDFPFVWVHRVKAVQIRPLMIKDELFEEETKDMVKCSTWNVDMDLVQTKFIELRVHRQLLAVFGEGISDDDFPTTSCRCL